MTSAPAQSAKHPRMVVAVCPKCGKVREIRYQSEFNYSEHDAEGRLVRRCKLCTTQGFRDSDHHRIISDLSKNLRDYKHGLTSEEKRRRLYEEG